MTDLEINKALALAIGWKPEHVIEWGDFVYVDVAQSPRSAGWRVFDYRDGNVSTPIAERYVTEIVRWASATEEWWEVHVGMEHERGHAVMSDASMRKAIALAVIKGAKT